MQLMNRGVLVTGAGRGIGRALAHAAAARGGAVIVTDVDAEAARRVAQEVGGVSLPGDLSDPQFVRWLADKTRREVGFVDVLFSNAGVDDGTGSQVSDATWERVLDVNLMAHVRLIREFLPDWIGVGHGHVVVTASAAGLLTMIGNAPYSVSKHAAVAYAEWLAIEYGDCGLTVQALCPQGVKTAMLPESGPVRELLSQDEALDPTDVAEVTVDALGDDRFLILPHPTVSDYYRARAVDTTGWLANMRRLRQRTFG